MDVLSSTETVRARRSDSLASTVGASLVQRVGHCWDSSGSAVCGPKLKFWYHTATSASVDPGQNLSTDWMKIRSANSGFYGSTSAHYLALLVSLPFRPRWRC